MAEIHCTFSCYFLCVYCECISIAELSGVCFPGSASAVKLSAFADDVMVIFNKLWDIDILEANVDLFNKMSSAKMNWKKVKL